MVMKMSSYRFFTTTQIGEVTVAQPVDAYLQGTALAELLRHELIQIVDSTQSRAVVVNFDNVKLISSSVISRAVMVFCFASVKALVYSGKPSANRFNSVTSTFAGSPSRNTLAPCTAAEASPRGDAQMYRTLLIVLP